MMSLSAAPSSRSLIGAQGDRQYRQQTATGTKERIKNKIIKRRSQQQTKVDEEEWNQRMQIWEKKRERLSGSEWDKSFREAVRASLKGKKPWRTPISCPNKLTPRKIDSGSNSLEDTGNSRTKSSEETSSSRDEGDLGRTDSTLTLSCENKKSTPTLEVVGLKRECSTVELDVTNVDHSDSTTQQEELSEFKNKILKNCDSSKAKMKTSENVEEIILERTDSIIIEDPNVRSSTRYVKTVLSPIQSESECSKRSADVAISDDMIKEMKISESVGSHGTKDCSDGVLQETLINSLAEKNDQCLISEQLLAKKSFEELEKNIKNEVLSPQNSNIVLRSKRECSSSISQKSDIKLDSKTTEKPQVNKNEVKSGCQENNSSKTRQKEERDSRTVTVTPEIVKQIKELLVKGRAKLATAKTKEVRKSMIQTAKKDSEPKVQLLTKHRPSTPKSSIDIPRQESKLDTKGLVNITKNESHLGSGHKLKNENLKNEISEVGCVNLVVNHVQPLAKCSIDMNDENEIANRNSSIKHKEQEWNTSSSIRRDHKWDDWSVMDYNTRCNRSSETFISTNLSKERTLHAIFSSPDTEIFGSRKKPTAQPVFISSVAFEDSSPVVRQVEDFDARFVVVECTPNELFELRARARPRSDESLIIVDRSFENVADHSDDWYTEFHRPMMPSEEFEGDQKNSECFREIIIDRSGCRSFYNGCCHAEMSKSQQKCLKRYEVCHDASMCSEKHSKNTIRREYFVENCRTRPNRAGTVSNESWYSID